MTPPDWLARLGLLARGVVYARKGGSGIELVLPIAFLVQLKSWESEDPRSLRALIAQSSFETMSAIASHYLGRPATPPIALSLEGAYGKGAIGYVSRGFGAARMWGDGRSVGHLTPGG